MNTQEFAIALLKNINPSVKVVKVTEYFLIYDTVAKFVYDARYVYYGSFSLGASSQATFNFFGGVSFNVAQGVGTSGVTQPVMFNALSVATNVCFTGYRIEVDKS